MNVLELIGRGLIQQLAYVGGLTTQFWSGLIALPHVLPLVGKRGRWQSAIRQMCAIGVDALPMVGIVSACGGFILAIQSASELSKFGAMQLVIDIVVASILMSLGMMMLSPVLIALPFKLMLFVLADGWNLLLGSLAASFAT